MPPGDKESLSLANFSRSLSDRSPVRSNGPGRYVSLAPTKNSALISLSLVRCTSPATTWSTLGGITPTLASSRPASSSLQYSFRLTFSSPRSSTNLSNSSITILYTWAYSFASASSPSAWNRSSKAASFTCRSSRTMNSYRAMVMSRTVLLLCFST